MRLGKVLHAPLLHFVVAGALLFAGSASLVRSRDGSGSGSRNESGSGSADRIDVSAAPRSISIDSARLDALRRELTASNGRDPTPAELERAIALAVDEEILYREALAQRLDEGDPGIEARLVQKMLFLDDRAALADAPALAEQARALGLDREDVVIERLLAEKLRLLATTLEPGEAPDEAALQRAYAERRESLRRPTRRSLVHVFVSRDRRGDRMQSDAEKLRRKILEQNASPIGAAALGDSFPAGHALVERSPDELARQFGEAFSERVIALPIGAWSEPIPSAYGLHLAHVDAIVHGEIPAFAHVRERLRLELESDLRERKLAALLAELRTRYEVAVAPRREERK